MLIGGNYQIGVNNYVTSNRTFQGQLTENKKDVKWTELKFMKKVRKNHIAFKMRHKVYVAGGIDEHGIVLSCCELYDLNEKNWFHCPYALPFPLCESSVVVSNDETYAVITGGKKGAIRSGTIIVFTEEDGFQWLQKSYLESSRSGHVSIVIK